MSKFTDEERNKITIEIADYIIENNSSTRKAAEHFGISNATVSDWMKYILKKIDNKKYLKVEEILNKNKPKTIIDLEVSIRVYGAANAILKGKKVEQIAKEKGVTINVINEDLQTRLPRMDEELYKAVKTKQEENSRKNLQLGSDMSVEEQKRDENGRFTK